MHPELRKAMDANRAKRKVREDERQQRNAEIAEATRRQRSKQNEPRPGA